MRLLKYTTAERSEVAGHTVNFHKIHGGGSIWKGFKVSDDLPDDIAAQILEHPSYQEAPKGMIPYDPNREEPTSGGIIGLIEGKPLNITDEERAALPPLEPLGDGPLEYAVGVATGKPRKGKSVPADGKIRIATLSGG